MSEIYESIAQQISALGKDAPILQSAGNWYTPDGKVLEPVLAEIIIKEHSLTKCGKVIRDAAGGIVMPDTVKRWIMQELSGAMPTNTSRICKQVFNTLFDMLPEKGTELHTITAAELAHAELKKPAFVLRDMLPCGLTVLAAAPKVGKSWLCLALADAIATGGRFWSLDTNPGAVLYMALEDSEYRLKERLSAIGSTMPERLTLATHGAKRLDAGLFEQLESWIKSTPDPRLIVIDTLARVKGAAIPGLNGYEADTQQFAPLQELAMKNDVAILVITHYSKAKRFSPDDPFERISGTTGLFGVSDAAWIIDGKRGEENTLRITGRDAIGGEYKIKLNGVRWEMLGDSETLDAQRAEDAYKADPIARTIKALVTERGRWEGTAQELEQEIMTRCKVMPAADPGEFGRKLTAIAPLLLTNDDIAITRAKIKHTRQIIIERATKPII